ncbi:class I SAM-dependent DNA methyltransferase [Catellatospora tritici]|uniref:class I SAM-dependent DNA methyltransferase n=1 Tax=Catellatospora tritici TaxID=2851566 RepID=UPI0027DF0BFD|nr:methyltransferase domain-containing protein [Catellatospora tritici]
MTDTTHLDRARAGYDAVAEDYAELFRDELDHRPVDRSVLALFAELVRESGGGPVADLGCGPGRISGHLLRHGLTPFGVDLSPRMIDVARRTYPDLRFDVGTLTELDLPDGELAGIVAWYSLIHTPTEHLPKVFAEFHRVLAPGGHLVVAFQIGTQPVHLDRAYGHDVPFDVYLRTPELVADLLAGAGLPVHTQVRREPGPGTPEKRSQAYLLATKAAA